MGDIIPNPRSKAIASILSSIITRGFAECPVQPGLNMIFDQLRVFGEPDFLAAHIDKFWVIRFE